MRKVLAALTFLMALLMSVTPALAWPNGEEPTTTSPTPEEPGPPPSTNYPPVNNNITINVNNNTVVGGQIIIVAGNNAAPGATITITIGGNTNTIGDVIIANADAAGAFKAKAMVPKDIKPGPALLKATASNGETASAALVVEPSADAGSISAETVSPDQTDPGQLPFTGARTLPSLAIGVGLILAGGALLFTVRRRHASRTD
jgi:hypothetical protein